MWSRNSWLPPIFAISSMLISLLCVLSVQHVHFPSTPGPERSISAVNSSSRQCSGSQTAARESYLQPNATASSVGFPQLQDVIVGIFSDWPVAAFSESTCAWVFIKLEKADEAHNWKRDQDEVFQGRKWGAEAFSGLYVVVFRKFRWRDRTVLASWDCSSWFLLNLQRLVSL